MVETLLESFAFFSSEYHFPYVRFWVPYSCFRVNRGFLPNLVLIIKICLRRMPVGKAQLSDRDDGHCKACFFMFEADM